jgi:hypothetical protein
VSACCTDALGMPIPCQHTRPDDLQRKASDSLLRQFAELEIRAWQRDGEEVVTMSRTDIDKLLRLLTRARALTRTRQRMAIHR